MSASPAVAVVIAVYQRPRVLEFILQSLQNQTATDFELALADDGSDAAVADVVQAWKARFAHPIRHAWHENRGFRKTLIVNRAVAETTADYLVFIDGDCIVHHRFIERHVARRQAGQVLSGRRVMLDPELTARLTLDDVRTLRIERPLFWWRHAKAHDLRNGIYAPALYGWRGGWRRDYAILGSNFSLYRDDFVRVNGYDEAIVGRGMEDINLRTRLLNAGCVVRSIAQEALQYHCHHEAAPMPHGAETTQRWRSTTESWTPRGMVKGVR
jgi:glycosyltransferase involved in cell wall biosynthesis